MKKGYFGRAQEHLQSTLRNASFKPTPLLSAFTQEQILLASNKLPLVRYLIANMILRENPCIRQMHLHINLANVSVLSNLILLLNNAMQNKINMGNNIQDNHLDMSLINGVISSSSLLCKFNATLNKHDATQNIDLNLPLINHIVSNPAALNVLTEFNVISNKQRDTAQSLINNKVSTNRKRQAPDFDDYNVLSSKRIKSHVVQENSDDSLDFHNDTHSVEDARNISDEFQIINKKWNTRKIGNPHVDHTYRVHMSVPQEKGIVHLNGQQNVSCLVFFDEEIQNLYNDLCYIHRQIVDLQIQHRVYYTSTNYCKILDQINTLKLQEHAFKNKYASLCDARDEIFQLYVRNKKSFNFNAEFISLDELAINKRNREILNNFRKYY